MTIPSVPLDRILLDRLAICPRSSMLRVGAGDRPEAAASPWWVFVASARLPHHLDTSHATLGFRGATAGGREIRGEVRIVSRQDTAHGTELILSGLGPLGGDVDSPAS